MGYAHSCRNEMQREQQMSADLKAAILETEDFHRRVFREQCARDERLRRMFQPHVEPEYERDAAEYFAAEQCPSDATFR